MQRRRLATRHVDRGIVLDEQLHDLESTVMHGDRERTGPVVRDLGLGVEQEPHDPKVPRPAGFVQGTDTAPIHGVDVGTMGHENLGHVQGARVSGQMQRCR